jgi:CRP/FNR family transcriptional regulator, cyclic AMP receptor protein
MREFLDHCHGCSRRELASGEVLLRDGERTGCMFVLAEGCLEVFRGEVEIATVDEPGSVFGEMATLLDIPHTTSVRALGPAAVLVIENAADFLAANPPLNLPIARLLAQRLQNVTTYLVDLKRQFADHESHLGMVDEVLDALTQAQGPGFIPESELPVGR